MQEISYTRIAEQLRQSVVAGMIKRGARLPNRLQLARQLGANPSTVQRAMDELTRSGWIVSRGRAGTFVVERPPHLFCHGLLLKDNPQIAAGQFTLERAIYLEAMRLQSLTDQARFSVYLILPPGEGKSEESRLRTDLDTNQLADLLLPSGRGYGEAILDIIRSKRAPIVAMNQDPPGTPVDVPSVREDWPGFFDRALDHLHSRGRRRIAIMAGLGSGPLDETQWPTRCFGPAAARRGMTVHPHWWGLVPSEHPVAARYFARLLMSGSAAERPDGLLITEDNLVEETMRGVAAAGAHVPENLDVVALANFPLRARPAMPVTFLGFDVRHSLLAMIELAGLARQGGDCSTVTSIVPQFESEVRDPFVQWAAKPAT